MSIPSDWFDPIPIDDYISINEKSSINVPESTPVDKELFGGELDIRCGPILKLSSTLENGSNNYRGTILLVLKVPESAHETPSPPSITYKIGPSESSYGGSVSSGEFPGTLFFEAGHEGLVFFRYTVELSLIDYEQKVKYFINNNFKKSFQFFIPSVHESMNVISFSCNGFSLGTDASEFKSSLWMDVLKKHQSQHYHVMLGGGDQIYSDAVKLHSKYLEKWMSEQNPLKKLNMPATNEYHIELNTFYLNHYIGWFGKGFWKGLNGKTLQTLFPLTMSQIPSVNIYDDHDIIDGFGSYHDSTMKSPVFSAVGNTAYKYYMIFQHHINPEEKLHESDPAWILGNKPGPFITQKNHSLFTRLGKEISLVGIDCRTERKLKQVVTASSYSIIFDRLKKEIKASPETKHLLVMLGIPIFYPRLVWLEWLLTSTLFLPIRALASKGVINHGLVNEFDGDVEVLDDLNDHWCSKYHKKERNKLIQDLMSFGSENGLRITILSGDVHLAAIGRFKSKFHHHLHAHRLIGEHKEELIHHNQDVTDFPESDPRLMFNVISSAIINGPPPDAMANLLNARSSIHHYNRDTDEDMVPIFVNEPTGEIRSNVQFLNKRNWSDLIIAKQSIYKSEINATDPIRKFPQPVKFDQPSQGKESNGTVVNVTVHPNHLLDKHPDERHIKYPLFEDSLVTTIHVEQDPNDFSAPSTDYEILIPALIGKFEIDRAPVKHLS
ncbi:hypothetical protein DFJ63DRAFT_287464 [Scheffersomyces coipomensis]|uniref:uncharacterized protein n=1 Tax=Scheffersomyces coipomensis TaxID=1788519 RepID=UPI00315D5453